ncbi:MAG: flagellin lysine-N-methylase, partial [Oscillospiraceae bacterium]
MEHQILVPDYYEKFACKGSDCRYNCCQDWEISFSKADYLKIRNAKKSPDMEAAVKTAIKRTRENGSDSRYASFFDAKTGRCAMQDADGLCRLQAECGYQTLPAVCQEFPRNKVLAPVPEQSCFIGCERVVELLMESSAPLSFHYRTAERGELPPNMETAAVATIAKRPIYQYYSEIQALCIDILQNRAYPLDDRMILLGIALKSLHELEVAGKVDELPQWLQEKQQFAVGDDWKDSLAALPG